VLYSRPPAASGAFVSSLSRRSAVYVGVMRRLGSGLVAGAFALLCTCCRSTPRQPSTDASRPLPSVAQHREEPRLPLSAPSSAAAPSNVRQSEASRILLLRGDKSPYEVLNGDGSVLPHLRLAAGDGASEWIGDERPKLSPEEPLVAEIGEDGLWLREFDGTGRKVLRASAKVWLTLGGWSPDGQTLLFHQQLHSDMDDQPNVKPHGVTGFYLLHRKDYSVERLSKSVRGVEFWDDDSQHFIFFDLAHLIRMDVHGGAQEILRECKQCFQFSHFGQRIVFWQPVSESPASTAQKLALKTASLRDKGETVVFEGGSWAEYQWPKASPNGEYIAFVHGRNGPSKNHPQRDPQSVEVIANHSGAKPQTIYECELPNRDSHCSLEAWTSEQALIVLNNGVAKRVTLRGEVTTLASNIQYVISGS
jgi:hypothetical protein